MICTTRAARGGSGALRGAARLSRRASRASQFVAAALVAAMLVACGSANVNVMKRYRGARLPAPRGIVVYDFDLTGDSVGLGENDEGRSSNPVLSAQQMAERRDVARVLAESLVAELENCGLPASRGTGPLVVPPGSMAIGGQIVTVDAGSTMGRVLVGFDKGRSRISSLAQLTGNSEGQEVTLLEFQNTAKSGARPGLFTTLPGFLAQGVGLLADAIGAGAGGGELSDSVVADAKRTAKELAKAVEESIGKVARNY